MISSPGGYDGYGWGGGNMSSYSNIDGTTTCMATGYSEMCF